MILKRLVRRTLRRIGWDIIKFSPARHTDARISKLIQHYEIDLVLDCGANDGQYGCYLREIGYAGRIVSFEPLAGAFSKLKMIAAHDRNWEVRRCALGGECGQIPINVSENSQCSSILPMLPGHTDALPTSQYIGKEIVPMNRLDDEFQKIRNAANRIMLKIDTQGYEMQILNAGALTLQTATLVQVEMSLIELYEGAPTFSQLNQFMTDQGFTLASIEPVFTDPKSGSLLQVDGVYINSSAMS